MGITATNKGSNYTPIEAGSYAARCYSMVHIGTVKESVMGTEKELNKVRLTWELPTELKVFKEEKGEQPQVISKEFTLSMHEKSNLRKFLESWRGKGFTEKESESFDITVLIGKPCMISVIHKQSKSGNVFAEISNVSAMPKGMVCPPQINESFEFNFTPFDQAKFDKLPDFLKDKIKTSKEYKEFAEPNHTEISSTEIESQSTDDLPF